MDACSTASSTRFFPMKASARSFTGMNTSRSARRRDATCELSITTRQAVEARRTGLPHPAGDRKKHRALLRFRNRRKHHRVRLAPILYGQSEVCRDRFALRHALLSSPRHRQEDGRLWLHDSQGARRDDGDRVVYSSLFIFHLRLRFRGSREGSAARFTTEGLRRERTEFEGADEEALSGRYARGCRGRADSP